MNNPISYSKIVAIVPSAGTGSRMRSSCPKQYLHICGKTIIEHSLTILLNNKQIQHIVVAIHPEDTYFNHLTLARDIRITTVYGGLSRFDSVIEALKMAGSAKWVLIHDAARPCIYPEDLCRLLALTSYSRVGGILAVPINDTIKHVLLGSNYISHTVSRNNLWQALTPQVFPLPLLQTCLSKVMNKKNKITDEATALEFCGFHPEILHGRRDNLKITEPEDLALARLYLMERDKKLGI
ncbi:2-C-methyl-D-erythritol 4-phosphate cytidylyltransferase [Candidatus Erwinia haradaeae]|uniref:2-C-methyl-D-erythritol 4-phosphate cytidylyltransferase n=1 Tax=Candidatus Erwinia haradaeae TaxID=1922217 RepID=A0A451D8T4_9GAMM|nr:2-C-methyl-D-erythritol 4-phosphate cytidylyltransferase [Candidatus Erwinia haradaeae]VFP82242.1 2-C-methyl-D-erythritol 4-phosphate cytidylyltransferase [Candidatus Erwinia haradaeae]